MRNKEAIKNILSYTTEKKVLYWIRFEANIKQTFVTNNKTPQISWKTLSVN